MTPRRVDNNHQGPEEVRSNRDKALLAFCAVVFNGEGKRVVKHSVALGKRHTVLLEVCRILLRVELGGHSISICTLCIYVNVSVSFGRALNVPVKRRALCASVLNRRLDLSPPTYAGLH